MTPTFDARVPRLAQTQWVAVPRRLTVRFPAVRGLAGDGHVVVTAPLAAAVLPGAVLLLALLAGLLRLGYDDVYTESVVLLAILVAIGFFSSQLGLIAVVGFCLGDMLTADHYQGVSWSGSLWFSGPLGSGPLATLVHGVVPRLITYLLLAAAVVLLPRAARAVVASVGRGRAMPPLVAWGIVSALLVVIAWLGTDAWVAAAPTLIRPLFTWASPGGAPTVQAVATLQETGGVVVAAAVVAVLARQLWIGATMLPGPLQDRLRAAEEDPSGALEEERAAAERAEQDPEAAFAELTARLRPDLPPAAGRRVGAAVATSALATLTLAGILEQAWLWFAAFAVLLAVRLVRTSPSPPPWLERWRRIAAFAPAWTRLIALWLISRLVVGGVSNDVIGSYSALGVFVLLSIVVVFAFFPGEPRQDRADADDVPPAEPPPDDPASPGPSSAGPTTTPDPRRPTGPDGPVLRVAEPRGGVDGAWRRRLRAVQLGVAVWTTSALVALFTAPSAAADNCSVFSDCFGVANSAVEAAFGLALLAALSMVLDFVPVIGTIKGVIEAVTGRDLLTGQELAWWERALGVLPILAGLGALGAAARMGRNVPTPPRGARVPDGPPVPHGPRVPDGPPVPHGPRTPDGPPTPPRTPDAPDGPPRSPDGPPRDPDGPPRDPDGPPRDPDGPPRDRDDGPPRDPDAPPRDWPENPKPGTPEHDLGFDPATNKFRPSEYETATRIMDELGVDLARAPAGSSADWVDAAGNTYDAVGNFPARFFEQQWDNFTEQIVRHLDKADFVPVDVSTFSPEQIARVREFIEPLGPRVFIVGG